MSPEMHAALWITAVGSAVLFGSIAGLVGLMYVLTAGWLFTKDERPLRPVKIRKRRRKLRRKAGAAEAEPEAAYDAALASMSEESERRRQAVAIAVVIACAGADEGPIFDAGPSEWRLLHRARRLAAPALRRKAIS
jgi:hypothetical protein